MQLGLGYPSEAEEDEILLRYQRDDPLVELAVSEATHEWQFCVLAK